MRDGDTTSTIRAAITQALADAMESDERVFCIGEDIADPMGGSYKVTAGLSTRFGEARVRNTPISEGAIVGAAIGAALAGMRPVAEIMYGDFLTVAMDQVVNQAAFLSYMSGGQLSVPIVIRCQGGAWRGSAAQHSKSLEAWFAHVPGLKYVMPTTVQDAYDMMRWAIQDPDPVIFYESNLLYGNKGPLSVSNPDASPTGSVIRRPGKHATLVAWGMTVAMAVKAAEVLYAGQGIDVEVIEVRTLAPLDLSVIEDSVKKTGLLAIAHEAWTRGGLGGEIAASISSSCFHYLDGPIRRIGALNCPHPFSPPLEEAMLPSEAQVVRTIQEWFE